MFICNLKVNSKNILKIGFIIAIIISVIFFDNPFYTYSLFL